MKVGGHVTERKIQTETLPADFIQRNHVLVIVKIPLKPGKRVPNSRASKARGTACILDAVGQWRGRGRREHNYSWF